MLLGGRSGIPSDRDAISVRDRAAEIQGEPWDCAAGIVGPEGSTVGRPRALSLYLGDARPNVWFARTQVAVREIP